MREHICATKKNKKNQAKGNFFSIYVFLHYIYSIIYAIDIYNPMKIRIITLPFDENSQTFNDNVINNFCLNKNVTKITTKFFSSNSKIYWTVAISYTEILKPNERIKTGLTESQKKLFLRLKEWRVARANKEGIPVFLIAKNIQLEEIVIKKCITLECLKNIKGIGDVKTAKYGKDITTIVKTFYEQNKKLPSI